MKTLIIVTIFIFILVMLFFSVKTIEGLESPGGSESSSPAPIAVKDTSNISALEKFANALSSAFSPLPAPSASATIAKPAWSNSISTAKTNVAVESAKNCAIAVQTAVDPLPIDQQAQTTINKHSSTINNFLDEYDSRLKKIETLLLNPDSILTLNTNIGNVVNLGIPTVTVNYDENSNSVINLSVVKGAYGPKGNQPDSIDGTSVIGDIGSAGVMGINPTNVSEKNLPFWQR